MRSGAKIAVISGVFVVFAGGVGYGAYNVYDGLTGGNASPAGDTTTTAEVKTGPLSAAEVDKAAKDFLTGWAKGDEAATVAQLTNDPATAEAVIGGYRDEAHVTDAVITPGQAVGAKVPFTVKATVSLDGKTKPLSYASELTVVRGLTTGRPLVDWAPSVIHPKLTKDTRLVTNEASAPPIKAVDRDGVELTKEKFPSLRPILDELRKRYGDDAGGTPGVELVLRSDTESVPDETLLTLAKGTPGELTTTLDAGVQAAAEQAVKKYSEASVAAVKPSTGEILAVANNRKDGWNAAMLGRQAPGSTMKIVTAAMLLEKGLVAADRAAECPKEAMYQGRTFRNLDGFSIASGTFTQSFARSCNTAFIKLIDDTKDDAALKAETEEVFGIGLDNWKTGVASFDGSVPAAAGGEAAAQYIGQGTVQMNVLNMASITATAKNGSFKQPIIVPRSLDDRQLATAARSLPYNVASQLRSMMRVTATSGTAANAMSGLGGDKGAKTGSAEVDGQATSNSWFTGYQNDLAAAAVVQAGGHGGDAAGPVVASVLAAG
ncbi:penicillin-binding transpeptidase domain-containing protein [Streptomyces sp. 35G-GA-8]|uniref:penicillin-binding transpeptidase domain-containing protein n=1 Tax=Streptomyces sp. 35G-GA-8 TaxID=2939434 RepID=UPI00201F7C57|nr:penicillin-binding transpeptidase domain-containing protein [Streptomyces sp. 35G-GA-8]MCL7380759.1 penicillin-binding transpeptidase domain-containing protein [Streptomyces sp. 35G-GA-8]